MRLANDSSTRAAHTELNSCLVLQLFLTSPKATLKFAAIRTLAQLAQVNPAAVQSCNLDMEKLINDDNRSVATFAITTLLKVKPFTISCGPSYGTDSSPLPLLDWKRGLGGSTHEANLCIHVGDF